MKNNSTKYFIILSTLIFFTVCAVFIPGTAPAPELTSDDVVYVGEWSRLEFTIENIIYYFKNQVLYLYSPLVMVSLMFDKLLYGENFIFGAHITNLLLHAVSAVLFFKLLTMLHFYRKGKPSLRIPQVLAAAVSLLWAVHPQRAESVAWICERKDTLVTLFLLCSALSFITFFRKKKLDIAGAIPLAASFLCKPMLITFPALAAVFIFCETRGKKFFANLKYLIPSLVVSCGYVILNSKQMGKSAAESTISNPSRILEILGNIGRYFAKTFNPLDLNTHYSENLPLTDIIPLAAVTITFVILLKSRYKKFSLYCLLPCIALFVISVLPVSGVVPIGSTGFADRYSYIPSLFIAIATGFIFAAISDKYTRAVPVILVISGVVILFCCTETRFNCTLYRSPDKYLEFAILRPNPHPRMLFSYGHELLIQKKYDDAEKVANYFNTPEAKGTVKETFHKTVTALINIHRGNIDYGLAELDKVIFSQEVNHLRIFSRNFAKDNLPLAARLHLQRGNIKKATTIFAILADFYGVHDQAERSFYYGINSMILGKYAAAEKHFESALKIHPENMRFKTNLNEARKRQGKTAL